jgi:hypothetical protein
MMSDRIEMRRLSDGAVYRFLPLPARRDAGRRAGLAACGQGHRHHPRCALGLGGLGSRGQRADGTAVGHPAGEAPPQGDWVSRRGANSFVYTLVYV